MNFQGLSQGGAGEITYFDKGQPVDVLGLKGRELKDFRRRIQFMFQDPFGSLNPRMTVYDIISEPLVIHEIGTAQTRADTVRELMRLVGQPDTPDRRNKS